MSASNVIRSDSTTYDRPRSVQDSVYWSNLVIVLGLDVDFKTIIIGVLVEYLESCVFRAFKVSELCLKIV